MRKKVYIIHGWEGFPEQALFLWLKRELEERGYKVTVPFMPDTAFPKIDTWINTLKKLVREIDTNTILIGHSIGCQTILRYLETLPVGTKVGKVVLIAGWTHLTPKAAPDTDSKAIIKPWIETPIDWMNIRCHTDNFTAIFSSNDPYVPISEKDVFEKELGAKIVIEEKMGHFTEEDGVTKIVSVLNAIIS